MMPRAYDPDFRLAVVRLHSSGKRTSEIASELGICQNTVRKYIRRYPNVSTGYKSCGRPKILQEDDELNIVLASIDDPFRTANGIRRLLDLDVSIQTINTVLRANGLKTRHAATKIKLDEDKKRKRIEWATFYRTGIDWQKAIFVDECCISSEKQGTKLVKRPINTRFDAPYLNLSNHCKRKLVSVFGMVSSKGLGPIATLNSRLNGHRYIEILNNYAVNYIRRNFGPTQTYWIEDNCPSHRARDVSDWFESCNRVHGINVTRIQLPPYSPDLNIIENVWGTLKYKLLYDNFDASSAQELWLKIIRQWDSLNEQDNYVNSLYESIENRIESVIHNDGNPIKY